MMNHSIHNLKPPLTLHSGNNIGKKQEPYTAFELGACMWWIVEKLPGMAQTQPFIVYAVVHACNEINL